MKNSYGAIWLPSVLLFLGTPISKANPVTYTFSGTGTGTLGSASFTNVAFVLTMMGDTSDVGPQPSLGAPAAALDLPTTIDISGVGLATLTGTTFIYNGINHVGMGEGNRGLLTAPGNLIEVHDPSLAGYDLTTEITASGPNVFVSVRPQFINAATDLGSLTYTGMETVTFNAVVSSAAAPEPETKLLAIIGLVGLLLVKASSRKSGNLERSTRRY